MWNQSGPGVLTTMGLGGGEGEGRRPHLSPKKLTAHQGEHVRKHTRGGLASLTHRPSEFLANGQSTGMG